MNAMSAKRRMRNEGNGILIIAAAAGVAAPYFVRPCECLGTGAASELRIVMIGIKTSRRGRYRSRSRSLEAMALFFVYWSAS